MICKRKVSECTANNKQQGFKPWQHESVLKKDQKQSSGRLPCTLLGKAPQPCLARKSEGFSIGTAVLTQIHQISKVQSYVSLGPVDSGHSMASMKAGLRTSGRTNRLEIHICPKLRSTMYLVFRGLLVLQFHRSPRNPPPCIPNIAGSLFSQFLCWLVLCQPNTSQGHLRRKNLN